MYYSHGERSVFISNESHKKICRVFCRGQNVDKCILDILSNSVPELVSSAASKIVSKECQRLRKRGSGSILQTKSYDSIFRFTWDELNKEIQIRAPNMLQIVSSIISDTVIPPTEKKYVHLMNTVATALHGRSDQMSCLQYQVGFILTHGACKQRVRFI